MLYERKKLALDMQTRLNLPLVSKKWRRLTLDILYRTIFLASSRDAELLSRLMEDRPDLRGLVSFLHVLLRPSHREPDYDSFTSSVTYLLENCPKLLVFTDNRRIGNLPDVLDQRAKNPQAPPYQLQFLDGFPYSGSLSFRHFLSLKYIRYLDVGSIRQGIDHSQPILSLPYLETLSTIIMPVITDEYDEYLGRCDFPKLHSHYISIEQEYSEAGPNTVSNRHPFDDMRRFWGCHGSKIKTLRVRTGTVETSDPDGFPVPFSKISFSTKKVLPNLCQVIVDADTHSAIMEDLARCSSVQILEIIMYDEDKALIPVKSSYGYCIAVDDTSASDCNVFNRGIGDSFESLKRIRFANDIGYLGTELVYSLNQYISNIKDALRDRGIHVESLIKARV